MQILEHGQAQERTLLFFPCTAEPVWAFADTITLLSQRWHVFQVVYDGHRPEYPGFHLSRADRGRGDLLLKSHGVSRLGGAYGCSMGGACLTRMLALGEMPIDRAIIDGGITPYQLLYPVRKLLLWRDIVSFKMAANSRKILEAAFPPERFTPAGHDPKKEYDAMEAYLKTFSDRTIRNVFWSANNYALPKRSAKIGAKITYWYGDDEKKDRRRDIRFIKRYFPKARIHGIPKMAHAELVMVHPEKILPVCGKISDYLIDDKYLFTGDTLWFGADGGYSFISSLAESNKLAVKSLAALEQKLQSRDLHPLFLTGHTGWTDNFEFAFAHKDKLCSPFKKRVPDPTAPYDAYDESDDTEEVARAGYLQAVGR